MGAFWFLRRFIIDSEGGGGGLISLFILSKIAILDNSNEKLGPPLPPISMMGKWARFGFCGDSSLIRGEGGSNFSFYSVQDCSSQTNVGVHLQIVIEENILEIVFILSISNPFVADCRGAIRRSLSIPYPFNFWPKYPVSR